jgi:hypothetical protein
VTAATSVTSIERGDHLVPERNHDRRHMIEACRTLIGDQDAEMLGLRGGAHGC